MRTPVTLVIGWLILSLIVSIDQAFADRWLSPTVTDYYSSNSLFRLRVTPAEAPSSRCTATFYERMFPFWYVKKWTTPLPNRVAPVSALVSESARYVVTFDNWHQVGYGDEVVVVYDGSDGRLLWKYRLEDLLNKEELCQIRCSVSSRWWSLGKHAVDEARDKLVLNSVRTKTIDLKTGQIASAGREHLGADKSDQGRALVSITRFPCQGCGQR